VTNLYSDEVGNPNLPSKLQAVKKHHAHVRWAAVAIGLLVVAALAAGVLSFLRKGPARSLATAVEKSIAVLPFENLSRDPDNAYFADGVQDEILTNLAKIADLKVISRTSVMQYKTGAARNLREIGKALGVSHLLEGSVQRAANRVRVNAQLIDARTDAHLWAQTYDRDLADVFAIQSEIAKAIADQLQAKISPGEKAAITLAATTDLTANELYMQAKGLEFKPEQEQQNFLQAVRLLDEAVARDPNFVRAYCALGRIHLTLFWGGYDHTPARRELANAAIQKAVRLQPDAGEVHLALARYAYHGFRDYDRARAELDLARRTLPNDAETYFLSALIDRRQGRWTEATRNFERVVELDPRNVYFLMNAGDTYQLLRRYAEAGHLFERAVAISPHNYYARIYRAFQPFVGRADVRPLRAELSAIVTEEPGAAEDISEVLFSCAMAERDSAALNRALALIPAQGVSPGGNFIYPREWFAAIAARAFKDTAGARVSFTAARAIVEKIVHDQPDYAPAWSLLGRIDAGLGRKEDAVHEGRRACVLLPLSKDAGAAADLITSLATIYAWIGDKDSALEQLALSAQIPHGVTYGELKLEPQWDSLRADPRFEQIVASLAPKEATSSKK
jgi:TolB-like protein/Tfp pilus assembly protein PilF